MTLPQVLTIAGSDPSGGAGVQADLKTFQANGVYGLSVITSVTAQNTERVTASYDLPIEIIEAQMSAVLSDFNVAAVKTGMLASEGIVSTVAAQLRQSGIRNLVVDPVMVSSSGFELMSPLGIECLVRELLPLAYLVTPNLKEAKRLAGFELRDLDAAKAAARAIFDLSGCSVLIKGGHWPGAPVDLLYDGNSVLTFEGERIMDATPHGTGCTYASAITANLAKGLGLSEAISQAKAYVTEAIRHNLAIGHGQRLMDHFYSIRPAGASGAGENTGE